MHQSMYVMATNADVSSVTAGVSLQPSVNIIGGQHPASIQPPQEIFRQTSASLSAGSQRLQLQHAYDTSPPQSNWLGHGAHSAPQVLQLPSHPGSHGASFPVQHSGGYYGGGFYPHPAVHAPMQAGVLHPSHPSLHGSQVYSAPHVNVHAAAGGGPPPMALGQLQPHAAVPPGPPMQLGAPMCYCGLCEWCHSYRQQLEQEINYRMFIQHHHQQLLAGPPLVMAPPGYPPAPAMMMMMMPHQSHQVHHQAPPVVRQGYAQRQDDLNGAEQPATNGDMAQAAASSSQAAAPPRDSAQMMISSVSSPAADESSSASAALLVHHASSTSSRSSSPHTAPPQLAASTAAAASSSAVDPLRRSVSESESRTGDGPYHGQSAHDDDHDSDGHDGGGGGSGDIRPPVAPVAGKKRSKQTGKQARQKRARVESQISDDEDEDHDSASSHGADFDHVRGDYDAGTNDDGALDPALSQQEPHHRRLPRRRNASWVKTADRELKVLPDLRWRRYMFLRSRFCEDAAAQGALSARMLKRKAGIVAALRGAAGCATAEGDNDCAAFYSTEAARIEANPLWYSDLHPPAAEQPPRAHPGGASFSAGSSSSAASKAVPAPEPASAAVGSALHSDDESGASSQCGVA